MIAKTTQLATVPIEFRVYLHRNKIKLKSQNLDKAEIDGNCILHQGSPLQQAQVRNLLEFSGPESGHETRLALLQNSVSLFGSPCLKQRAQQLRAGFFATPAGFVFLFLLTRHPA